MEREEYIRRLVAAFDAMDDRARHQQLRQFERAAEDYPRRVTPATTSLARVLPFKRVVGQ